MTMGPVLVIWLLLLDILKSFFFQTKFYKSSNVFLYANDAQSLTALLNTPDILPWSRSFALICEQDWDTHSDQLFCKSCFFCF